VKRALVAIIVLVACGGGMNSDGGMSRDGGMSSGGEGSECRAAGDCDLGLACAGPNDPQPCGVPPREACAGDANCTAAGDRCHVIADSCSPDGFGSECRPACSGDPQCGEGMRCSSGVCVAILCNAGFTCAAREVCDPGRISSATPVFDRHHGCFPIACTSDEICAGRSCVNGSCQDRPGTCVVPVPVP
jgi:hypothetical protein